MNRKEYLKLISPSNKQKLLKKIPYVVSFLSVFLIYYFDLSSNQIKNLVIPFFVAFLLLFTSSYIYADKNDLVNNVMASRVLAPFIFMITLFTSLVNGMPLFSPYNFYSGAVPFSVVFILIYLYANSYFQPDLDNHNIPGRSHFPHGNWIRSYKLGRFLRWLLIPINRLWFHMWQPFASLFTHRGVIHYPIIGVVLRVAYIQLIIFIIFSITYGLNYITSYFSISLNEILFYQYKVLKSLNFIYPLPSNISNIYWLMISLPIYISDLTHIGVDFYEAQSNLKPFCHKNQPRGLLVKIYRNLVKK